MLRTDLLCSSESSPQGTGLQPASPVRSNRSSRRSEERQPAGIGWARKRRGFTLLEVMIATAVTLLMMLSLAQIFKVIGDSMKQGRAVLELNNRLRSVVYRIRTDLDNLTAIPAPPADPSSATGYVQVFDGSMTDYSMIVGNAQQSRIGDVDDIFMATVRAGDVWFTGKVPLFVLKRAAPDVTTDANGNGIADDLESISIAAEHAEVAVFMEPVVANAKPGFSYANPDRNPGYLAADPAFFQDDNADGVPDRFNLHYRALLIRPDLNLASGVLPALYPHLIAAPQVLPLPDGSSQTLPAPLCDMARVHDLCDLSVRRVYNPSDGLPATRDYVAANSLEDLVDPANRFAHVQVTIPGTSSTSMPLLALGPKLSPIVAASAFDPYRYDPSGFFGSPDFLVGSGFLHPSFTLQGVRAGEDILATDLIAFDIRVFDPDVPLLGTLGGDGAYGTAADDDGDGNASNLAELGWAGSDDLVLSPHDPGYAAAVLNVVPSNVVGAGEYVDLAWARKIAAHGGDLSLATIGWSTLSGFNTDALYKSGYLLIDPTTASPTNLILQPCFDTWTTRYEGDGNLQAFRGSLLGNVRLAGALTLYGAGSNDLASAVPAWRQTAIDAGTDGIDNAGTGAGVDDISEMETLAPFPVPLRGLKISVRMEDPLTRQVKQMSASKEFISQ